MQHRGAPNGSPADHRSAAVPSAPMTIRRSVATMACVLAAGLSQSAWGQPHRRGGIRTDSLASAVPASARFFIELDQFATDQHSDRAAKADHLYQLLVGSDGNAPGVSADWRRTLRGLGIKPGEAAKALFTHRIAVAAPSWSRLAEGIVLVRTHGDDAIIRQTFPPDGMDTIDDARGTIVYRTRGVLSAAINGHTLILSQRRTRDSLYRRAVELLKDDRLPSLADDPHFGRSLRTAAADIDGWIYIDGSQGSDGSSLMWGLDRARISVAMNLGGEGVAFSVRAAMPGVAARPNRSAVSLDRVKLLPRTTVGAWTTRCDIRQVFQDLISRGFGSSTPGWITHLASVFDVETVADGLFEKLGSEVVVAWDQYLGDGPDVPQVALLVESTDAAGCAEIGADILQAIVDWLDLKKQATPHRRLRLSRTEYLGTPIYEIIWTDASQTDGDGASAIIDHPTFAALDDVFVLATAPHQVRNIIDTRLGLAPKLGDLHAFRGFHEHTDRPVVAAVAQPALAAQVVGAWLQNPDGTMRVWFDSLMGEDRGLRLRRGGNPRLGIGVAPTGTPGSVTIARVYPGGRAYGRLEPNDEILGLNGRLLSLADPAGDLRQRVSIPPASDRWIFRVRRGEHLLDAVVPAAAVRRVSQRVTDPAGALRQLQSVFELVDFAGVRITQPAADVISATIALRFAPTARSRATTR